MPITGLDINLTVGPFTVNRLPKAELVSARGAVAERCLLKLPDPAGEIKSGLKKGDAVDLFFGYRGGPNQMWAGKVTKIEAGQDQVEVTALSAELAFIETKVTECFHQETARNVVKRLMALAGINPGRLEGPNETLPHLIFSGRPVYECFKRLNETLERVYQLDLSAKPYWVGADGLGHWGNFDEPGPVAVLASGHNLISHNPGPQGGTAAAMLFPGLRHSQLVKISDARRAEIITKRALTVTHRLGCSGNLTTVTYGQEHGYG